MAFSGVFADRWGRRRFLIAGTLIPVPSYLVFATTTEPAWLIAASVLGGVGLANGAAGALTISSFDALLAEKASEVQRTRVFAASQALWSLALAVGSIAAAVPTLLRSSAGVGELESYRLPYLAMAVLTIAAAALLIPLREDISVRAARVAAGCPGVNGRDRDLRARIGFAASASDSGPAASAVVRAAFESTRLTSVPGTRRHSSSRSAPS